MKGVQKSVFLIVLVLASVTVVVRSAFMICDINADDLKPCQSAVTQPPEKPKDSCCNVLKTANLTCFCEFGRNNPTLLSLMGIDPDLARALPAKCELNGPADC
ncbi:hypothetical protein SUGI_0720940 [Cryptomeria japonica]|uniref:putative lipid-transfer protein DIR1 n=1 Tax=Cryptomeria japonica TaxID=3369 RepID=UPI002414983D|nr:putative lipid-transfer protein DIR1 [Cryptomeria japonica]GLJ35930.1 hypothetical protein SUGI_0720940 [Cryptomeria japonica]